MSEVWVAAIGAVVSAGIGAAVSSANAPGTAGTAPLKFDPVDIPGTQQQALNASVQGYDLSDADLMKRFPGLVTGNNQLVSDTTSQLTGNLDPTVQNAFANKALVQALSATGGGNSLAGVGPVGSFSGNTAATSIANQVTQKQDYDRTAFDTALAANPQRAFGLSGGDAVNLAIANTQGQNAYNQQKYALAVQQQNADQSGGF